MHAALANSEWAKFAAAHGVEHGVPAEHGAAGAPQPPAAAAKVRGSARLPHTGEEALGKMSARDPFDLPRGKYSRFPKIYVLLSKDNI